VYFSYTISIRNSRASRVYEEKILKRNRAPLGVGETSFLIQAQIEGMNPQQVWARDLLVDRCGHNFESATSYVREIGPEQATVLRGVIESAEDPTHAAFQFSAVLVRSATAK